MSSQPRDIVCQCGAQLAYLLRPALNEPTVNGVETPRCRCCIWDRQSGCVCVHACMCVYLSVPMSRGSFPPSGGDGKGYIKEGRQWRLLQKMFFCFLTNWMNLWFFQPPGFRITILVLITYLAASQGGILELRLCGEDTVCLSPLGQFVLCNHQLSAKQKHLPSK